VEKGCCVRYENLFSGNWKSSPAAYRRIPGGGKRGREEGVLLRLLVPLLMSHMPLT